MDSKVEAMEAMEALDADSTENPADKTSQPMEKTKLDQPEDGIMATTNIDK
jgi:hypothetical protein